MRTFFAALFLAGTICLTYSSVVAQALGDATENAVRSVVAITAPISKENESRFLYWKEHMERSGKKFDMEKYRRNTYASGVLLSSDGYIVTNNHVLENVREDSVLVTLADHRSFYADIVGADASTDLALLRIYAENLMPAKIRTTPIKQGEYAFAVGNPLQLQFSVTSGIVSAVGRIPANDDEPLKIKYYIQTNVDINPGSSGGGLFDVNGQLMGVNTEIYTGTGYFIGYSFAVPVSLMNTVVEDLKKNGKVTRAYLGLDASDLKPEDAMKLGIDAHEGALVESLDNEGPAFKAGLKKNDAIIAINDKRIRSVNELRAMLAEFPPGSTLAMKVCSGDSLTMRSVVLDANPTPQQGRQVSTKSSLNLTPDTPTADGVPIKQIDVHGAAFHARLLPKDVITSIDGKPCKSVEDISGILGARLPGQVIKLQAQRNGKQIERTLVLQSAR